MSKRMTQLISRYVGAGLLALAASLGIEDDGTLAANAQAIAAGFSAVIAFFIDVWMHRLATGSVLKSASPSSQVSKCYAWPAFLLVAIVMSAGCSMTDSQRYAMLSASYRASADTTATLIRTGAIDDREDLEEIRVINTELKHELDSMHTALTNDIPLDFQYIKLRVEALLGRLIQYQLDTETADDDGTSYHLRTAPDRSRLAHHICGEASHRRITRVVAS